VLSGVAVLPVGLAQSLISQIWPYCRRLALIIWIWHCGTFCPLGSVWRERFDFGLNVIFLALFLAFFNKKGEMTLHTLAAFVSNYNRLIAG